MNVVKHILIAMAAILLNVVVDGFLVRNYAESALTHEEYPKMCAALAMGGKFAHKLAYINLSKELDKTDISFINKFYAKRGFKQATQDCVL
jgi:hypothetical protein